MVALPQSGTRIGRTFPSPQHRRGNQNEQPLRVQGEVEGLAVTQAPCSSPSSSSSSCCWHCDVGQAQGHPACLLLCTGLPHPAAAGIASSAAAMRTRGHPPPSLPTADLPQRDHHFAKEARPPLQGQPPTRLHSQAGVRCWSGEGQLDRHERGSPEAVASVTLVVHVGGPQEHEQRRAHLPGPGIQGPGSSPQRGPCRACVGLKVGATAVHAPPGPCTSPIARPHPHEPDSPQRLHVTPGWQAQNCSCDAPRGP